MKRFFLYFMVAICFLGTATAQTKQMSAEDAAIGRYRSLAPNDLHALRWRSQTNSYSYIESYSKIYAVQVGQKELTEVLNLNDLNRNMKANELLEFPYIADYEWLDKDRLKLSHKHILIVYNVRTKAIELAFECPENAENLSYCNQNQTLAYTWENNLYLIDNQGKITAVTTSKDKNIVSGQSVSRHEFGIEKGIFWSPKGNFLAFYRKDETHVSDYPIIDITQRVATPDPIKYPMAGMPSEHVALGVYEMKTGQIRFIEDKKQSEQYLTCISWEPSEKHIYSAVLNRGQDTMKLNQYSAQTGKLVKTFFEEIHPKYVEPEHPLYFLDQNPEQFIWQSERNGFNHLYLYNTQGELIKQLTKGDWAVTQILGTDASGKTLFYVSTEKSPLERHAYALNMKNGKTKALSSEPGMHSFQFNKKQELLLDSYSNLEKTNVVQVLNFKGKAKAKILDSPNPLENYQTGEIELITIKAADGKTDLHGRLIKPANFDPNKKYPAVLYVYGGPHAQLVTNSWLADASYWQVYMAQKGFVMLTLDNRGSANRGLAFENVIHRQCGQEEMKDQLKAIDFLRKQGYVDMKRLGVHGWSYGGFMTISLALNHPELFKVAVAGGPVIDWKFYEVMYGERYMDTPQQNPEGYAKTSLLDKVENLKAKLLILHGGIDPVVVPQHTQSFFRQCVKKGVHVNFFPYPRSEHNVGGYDRIHLIEEISNFFIENL